MPPAQTTTSTRPPRPPASGARGRSRPTTARQPVLGLPASLVLHGLGIASIFFVFNSSFAPPEESHAVPVELVKIEQVTNVAAAAPPPPVEVPVKRDLAPPDVPPEPPMVQAEPAPDVQPPKIEVEKEQPRKFDTKQDISNLLNQLTAPSKPQKRIAPVATQGAGLSSAMTASLADALRSQIRPCWHPIMGAPNPADQIVRFSLHLNRDGSVASLQLLTVNGSPYTNAAAEAASRAIYECQQANGHSGYQLPANLWPQWSEFNPITFDPRQMQQ